MPTFPVLLWHTRSSLSLIGGPKWMFQASPQALPGSTADCLGSACPNPKFRSPIASMAVSVVPQSRTSKLCHLSKRVWVTEDKTGSQKFCSLRRKTEACGLSRDPRRKYLKDASLGARRPLTILTGPVPSQRRVSLGVKCF